MLVLGMLTVFMCVLVFGVLFADTVAEDAIITGNLVCQAGFCQAIECAIEGDAIHTG